MTQDCTRGRTIVVDGVSLADGDVISGGLTRIVVRMEQRGTVAVAAPEQLIDCRNARPACDIFSAGASLYYLLSGQYAYDFTDGVDPLGVVLTGSQVPLESRAPNVPVDVRAIVHRAMAETPDQRFASAS